MAFRPLTEAECGQKNSLIRLTSHVTHDHGFNENHSRIFPSNSSQDQLVEQFLQETRTLPQTFRMDDLMREMHEIESQRSVLPPVPASTVKDHLQHDDAWAQQYIDDGKMFHNDMSNEAIWGQKPSIPTTTTTTTTINKFDNWLNNNNSLDKINSSRLEEAGFWMNYQPPPPPVFLNPIQLGSTVLNENLEDDTKFEYSKFMKFMKQVGDNEINVEDTGKLTEEEVQSWSEEFLKNDTKDGDLLDDNWPKQSVTTDEDEFKSQYWNDLQEEFEKGLVDRSNTDNPWGNYFEPYVIKNYEEYKFSEDNPMLDIPNPLERGKELLKQGDLPGAVLCFEAAVKQEPENPEAWLYLGTTQSENEQDPNAIPALKQCLNFEPNNSKALMSLAICYTNESYYNLAGKTLVQWLENNPKYSDLVVPSVVQSLGLDDPHKASGQVSSILSQDQKRGIRDLFIKAAQRQPNDIDYEIQCALGVICNITSEYDKAADCFRAALSVKPDDAKLWNRLGATLANGSKSEEAVDAYHQALSIEPGFIRARYNVGIVCINLRAYKEAAEHFLTALNQQARGRNIDGSSTNSQMSDSIWSALRMCISLLNLSDLRPAVDNQDLSTLNRAFDIID